MNIGKNKKISFRLNDGLINKIDELKGGNRSEKVRNLIYCGATKERIDESDYSNILNEIHALKMQISPIGNNLNQLIRLLNEGIIVDTEKILPITQELAKPLKKWMQITKAVEKTLKNKI